MTPARSRTGGSTFAVTHDRALVVEAARSLLRCLTPVRAAAEPVTR